MKRLLILSASAGAGHTQAGRALEESARALHPRAEIVHRDILDFTSKLYRKAYAQSYLRMIDAAPALWGMLYRVTNRRPPALQETLARWHDKIEFAPLRRFVRDFKPDALLATHFLAGQIFAPYRRKQRDRFPLGMVVTDFDLHAFWVEPTVDRYFVGNEELQFLLAARGIEKDRIAVTGIPIAQKFSRRIDRNAARKKLGLDLRLPAVLVMSGGAGVGSMEETIAAAFACPRVQLLAVAGRNEKLRAKLARHKPPRGSKLAVFGFVDNIEELMAASDLAITKSGGLTSSECLAMGLPMLVREPVPGQEERNCDYLVELGAARRAQGIDALQFKLRELLDRPADLLRMAAAARAAGKPRAALEIVQSMVS